MSFAAGRFVISIVPLIKFRRPVKLTPWNALTLWAGYFNNAVPANGRSKSRRLSLKAWMRDLKYKSRLLLQTACWK